MEDCPSSNWFCGSDAQVDCDKNSVANNALRSKCTVSLAKHDKDIMHIEEIRHLSWFSVQIECRALLCLPDSVSRYQERSVQRGSHRVLHMAFCDDCGLQA